MSEDIRKDGLFEGGATTVSITLEDDKVLECVVLTIFEADGNEYIAVMPEEGKNPDIEVEDGVVYLYRYRELEDGSPELTNIETDEEYEIVADAFDEILDEQEYQELLEDED